MLTVNSISMEFGGEALFDNLSFQISAGERIGLTGKMVRASQPCLKSFSEVFDPHQGKSIHQKIIELAISPKILTGFLLSASLKRLKKHSK